MFNPDALIVRNPEKKRNKAEKETLRPGLLEELESLSSSQLELLARIAVEKRNEKMLDEARAVAFESLEKQGMISRSPEDLMLVDLEKLKSIASLPTKEKELFKRSLGSIQRDDKFGGRNFFKTLTLLFEDQKVLSQEDYGKGERQPKDLFYAPKNKEEALDVEKIKQSQFYMLLPELVAVNDWENVEFGKIPSLKKDPQNGLDYREAFLAALIYHPQYGDGYRGEKDGKLHIKRSDRSGEYGKISANYLTKKYGPMGGYSGDKGGSLNNSRLFVVKNLPNLMSRKMLLPDDFEVHWETATTEKEIASKDFRQRGMVMFNGVAHTVDNKFFTEDKRFRAYQLAPGMGGVIEEKEGQKKIVATFNIFQKETAKKSEKGFYLAGTPMTRAVDLERFSERQKNESEEEFQARMEKGNPAEFLMGEDNFENYLRVREKISKEADFNINKLPIEKQKQLVESMKEVEGGGAEERLLSLLREYREDGLKVLLAFSGNTQGRENIFKISEIDPKLAWPIFRKFNRIADLLENAREEIARFWQDNSQPGKEQMEEIRRGYLKTANEYLQEFSQLAELKSRELWKKRETELMPKIDSFSENVVLWANSFHAAQKRQESIPGSSLKGAVEEFNMAKESIWERYGAKQDILSGEEIEKDTQLREEIVSGYRENYKERPALADGLAAGYLEKIKAPKSSQEMKIFVLRVGGKLVAHCRFDGEKDGQVYFGSAFVTGYKKGKSVGKYFLNEALDVMGEKYHLHADCVPSEAICGHYISRQNFVVDKITKDYEDLGEPFIFHISREKTADIKKTYYQSIPREQIMNDYEADNFSEKDGRIILRFPIQKKVSPGMYPEEMKKQLTELINKKGFVMTGYFFVSGAESEKEKVAYCALERLDKSSTSVRLESA